MNQQGELMRPKRFKLFSSIGKVLVLIGGVVIFAILPGLNSKHTGPVTTYVVGWGENRLGEATGVPTPNRATNVVSLSGLELTNVSAIAAGDDYSLALKADGTVVGWGSNWRGRAIGIETNPAIPINGLVVINGQLLTNVAAICAGGQSGALTRDGAVVVWGYNRSGRIGARFPQPEFVENVLAISSGSDSYAFVRRDGRARCWGEAYQPPGHVDDVVAVAMASSFMAHGILLRSNHTVHAWGVWHDSDSQVEGATNVIAIAAGIEHYIALKSDGTVIEWGSYSPPIAGSAFSGWPAAKLVSHPAIVGGKVLNDVKAIAAGGTRSMALKNNGTVVVWGTDMKHYDKPVQLDVPSGLKDVVAIAAGRSHFLALTTHKPSFSGQGFPK